MTHTAIVATDNKPATHTRTRVTYDSAGRPALVVVDRWIATANGGSYDTAQNRDAPACHACTLAAQEPQNRWQR